MDETQHVVFDQDQAWQSPQPADVGNGLLATLLRGGYAKDEAQATNILLGVVVLAVIIAVAAIFFFNGSSPKPSVPSIDGTMPR